MVSPLRFEADPRPGQTATLQFTVTNTSVTEAQAIVLSIGDLSQGAEGQWVAFDTQSAPQSVRTMSAADWVQLETTEIPVEPAGTAVATIKIDVPRNAQGTYFAALLAEQKHSGPAEGLVVRIRFLVPIILRIQGTVARQIIELSDASMEYGPVPGRSDERGTLATLTVTNRGQTFSRVKTQLFIDRASGDLFRPVTRITVPDRGIIPGVALNLTDDLQRRLPSGTYRLRGLLWVDGRRAGTIERMVDFIGDPTVEAVAYDTALLLSPDVVRMDAAPGATRVTTVSVENPSEYPVAVTAVAAMPSGLAGMMLGAVRGEDFSAAEWTEVRPAEFTLRPGGRQNIRVFGRVPEAGAAQPAYYADLIMLGAYPDGQSAGETRSFVLLTNRAVPAEPRGAIDQIEVAETEAESQFSLQARFLNVGNVAVTPKATAKIFRNGASLTLAATLEGEPGALLPLGMRTFSEQLDFSNVAPDRYLAVVTIDYGGERPATVQRLLDVSEVGGRRSVTILSGVEPSAVGGDAEAGQ